MARNVVVVESPAKASTINSVPRWTMYSPALLSRVDKQTMVFVHSRVQLYKQGLETLKTALSQRTVYQRARFHGMTPLRFEPKGAAADDIRALGREVVALLEQEPELQQAVANDGLDSEIAK